MISSKGGLSLKVKFTKEQLRAIYEVCSQKELYRDWNEVADILNKRFGTEYNESTFRKTWQYFDKMYDACKDIFTASADGYRELEVKMRQFKKEKQKLNDERTEYNRLIRTEARKESYADMIKKIVRAETVPYSYSGNKVKADDFQKNSLLIHLTDIHTGIEIDNFFNKFNEQVLVERLLKFCEKIKEVQALHKSECAYIVIGEIVSGIIHNNLRLQNNLDLIEQFKLASEQIASLLVELSKIFKEIQVYMSNGNHSRLSPKKEDALDGENMDILLPFYLSAKLQNYPNVLIMNNTVEPEIAIFNIYNTLVMAAHGHKDSPSNVVQNFTMLFKKQPDIVLLGHRHTNGLTTVYDTKVIESGCVSGTDQYALNIRKANKPEQTISVINKEGLCCIYDVTL